MRERLGDAMRRSAERRERKSKKSIIDEIEDDVKDMQEDFATDHTVAKKEAKTTKPVLDEKSDHVGEVSNEDIQAIQLDYEKQFRSIQKELDSLKILASLSKNGRRLESAIRSEMKLQNTDKPFIGRTRLKEVYGINPKYLGPATKEVIDQKIATRSYAKNNSQTTSQWELL